MKKNFTRLFTILFLSLGLVFGLLACGDDKTDNPNTNNEETYSIVLPSVEHGSVTASSTSVKKGEAVELTVTPDEYYELDFLKANGKDLTVSNGKATINDIQEDQTITAAFVGVDVVVTFVVDGATLETKTLKYGAAYGTLPSVVAPDGYDFSGWYTEANGAGSLIEATTLVANGKAHSVYAYLTAKPFNVTVSGLVDKLVHYPDSESQSALLDIKVLADNVDVTNDVTIKVESSDASVVVVDGLTLKVAEGADGVAVVRVLVDGVEFKRFNVSAVDYEGLGYEKVSNKAEFLAMKGTGKYILTADIDLEGDWLANTDSWRGLIQTLEADAIIDGNGHVVKNGKVASGWNNGWIEHLKGTVKNIVFLNIDSPNTYPYATGLVGFGKGGTLENIYLQYNILADGEAGDVWKKAGTLMGCLETGHIKNCVVDFVVAPGVAVNNYGAIVGLANNYEGSVTNAYAIVHYSGVEALAAEVGANDIWEINVKNESVALFNSVYQFVESVGSLDVFDSNWNFDEGLSVFGVKVLEIEEALAAKIDSKMSFNFEDESSYIDFAVYRYGELSSEYDAVFTSSDESVFTTTVDGAIIFVGKGTATLTIVIDDTITLTTEITISENSGPVDEYTYIHNAEEWRTLITLNPDGKFKLANDIDLAGGWVTPNGESQLCKNFNGELDGQGYVVKNGWMPSGWAQPSAFGNNNGTIKNIGFVNIHGGNLSTDIALVTENFGNIENVFVDWIIETDGQAYGFAGVITGYSGTGTIKNCIVSLRLGDGLVSAPSFYGSIIGNANNWNGKLINSYAIVNGTGVKDVASKEAAEGVTSYLKSEGNSAQFETYTLLKASADLSGYDATLWAFTETTISFGGVEVYKEHVHTYAEGWSSDETYHWHAANCGCKDVEVSKEEHVWDEGVKEGTVTTFTCQTCLKTKEVVDGHTHTYSEEWYHDDTHHWHAALCDCADAGVTDRGEHTWGEGVVAGDNTTFTCSVCSKEKVVNEYTYISNKDEWYAAFAANPAGKFKLTNDIDLAGGWLVKDGANFAVETFTGVLDGNGYAVKNAWLSGGWNNGLFRYQSGTIKNIAFIGMHSTNIVFETALFAFNSGTIENVYLDMTLYPATQQGGNGAGTLVGGTNPNSLIKNCIVNVKKSAGDTVVSGYGAIVGRIYAWSSIIENSYAITNDTGLTSIAYSEAADGLINYMVNDFKSNVYQTYSLLKSNANLVAYDSSVWSFTDSTISFGGVVVLEVEVHVCDFSGEYKHDEEGHWHECSCGLTDEKVAHIGGEATTTEKAVCEVCGASYGDLKESEQTVITIYFQNNWDWVDINFYCWGDNGSNAEWPGKPMTLVGTYDGKELYKMELDTSVYHSFIFNGINLGWQAPNNRDQSPDLKVADYLDFYTSDCFYMAWDNGNKIGHCAMSEDALHLHQFNLTHDENQHWLACSCGLVSGEKENHKGGSATTTEKAVCEVCSQSYGELEAISISTVEEWLTLIPQNPNANIKLTADLDFNGGYISGKDATYLVVTFTGELDGQGHKIINAKLPGGWAGHAMISKNQGIIKNIAFINLKSSKVSTDVAIVATNQGIMENIYVDYLLQTGTHGTANGVLASFADNKNESVEVVSEIRNCIVNIRLAEGATLPPAQGSLVGKAGGWTGYVKNCYAILNDSGIADVCGNRNGTVADATCNTSAQFNTYQLLKAGADLSMYDSNIWSFTDTTISFFGNVVYEIVLEPVDEYTHITTVEEWLTFIAVNPAGKFKLDNDLDFEGGFITGKDATYLAPTFKGVLDGQGYQIKNAKLPGGWNGHAIFDRNEGIIKNIAFINITSNAITTNNALFNNNLGIIENLYVDYVLITSTYESSYNGVIASLANNPVSGSDIPSEIRNCIVNVRLADGATLPPNQGSIIGKAGGWYGFVKNCYALVNNTGITSTYVSEAAGGVYDYACGTSAQFNTYADAVASADVSMYDSNIWTFTETSISFGGVVVYSAQ